MSSSSIQRALSVLIKTDLVYQDNQGSYQVLNPVVKTFLADDKYFDLK
jgi:hypothetical protein